MISTYPEDKIEVGCRRCTKKARYDVREMLAAGGDRSLLDLLDAIKKRLGCEWCEPGPSIYDRCGLQYTNLTPSKPNGYAKVRDG